MKSLLTRRLMFAGTLAAVLGAAVVCPAQHPAAAHEARCPVCKLDVVQDADKLDNEVALKFGRKRIEYRCVYCALQDAGTYTGDITILAPSELKGKPVLLTRKEDKWTVQPETTVFVGQKVNHRSCQIGYRALTTRDAFGKWVQAHPELPPDARPLTFAEMLAVANPPK